MGWEYTVTLRRPYNHKVDIQCLYSESYIFNVITVLSAEWISACKDHV